MAPLVGSGKTYPSVLGPRFHFELLTIKVFVPEHQYKIKEFKKQRGRDKNTQQTCTGSFCNFLFPNSLHVFLLSVSPIYFL